MKFAIIIPTYNRPKLLQDALLSINNQNRHTDFSLEVIIIDDVSDPPVNLETLKSYCQYDIKLHRNTSSNGLAYNRDKGVQLCSADVVIHLDDDDKLASDAIDSIYEFYSLHPKAEILFLGVEGFGRQDYFKNAQHKALTKVLTLCKDVKSKPDAYFFSKSLFCALLQSVPMCFQRVAVKKATWNKVNNLRLKAYGFSFDNSEREINMRKLGGPLRDTEWAIYGALLNDASLLKKPVYLQRCEGQGLVSQHSMRNKQVQAQINIKKQLLEASLSQPEYKNLHSLIKINLADTLFNEAYYKLNNNNRKQSLYFLVKAFCIEKQLKYAKLFIKLFLPARLFSDN